MALEAMDKKRGNKKERVRWAHSTKISQTDLYRSDEDISQYGKK